MCKKQVNQQNKPNKKYNFDRGILSILIIGEGSNSSFQILLMLPQRKTFKIFHHSMLPLLSHLVVLLNWNISRRLLKKLKKMSRNCEQRQLHLQRQFVLLPQVNLPSWKILEWKLSSLI